MEICYLPKEEFPPCPPEIPLKLYRTVVKSMKKQHLLKLQYVKASYEFSKRLVIPEALVYLQGTWYLAAYCELRQARRTFRLDRILKAKMTERRGTPTGIGKEVKKNGIF